MAQSPRGRPGQPRLRPHLRDAPENNVVHQLRLGARHRLAAKVGRDSVDVVAEEIEEFFRKANPLRHPAHQLLGLGRRRAHLDDLRADIDSYVASCAVFEEYTTALDKLASEDWISFRQRLWVFDDFVAAWVDKSVACPPGAVAEHLRSELNRFRDVAPVLRYVREFLHARGFTEVETPVLYHSSGGAAAGTIKRETARSRL